MTTLFSILAYFCVGLVLAWVYVRYLTDDTTDGLYGPIHKNTSDYAIDFGVLLLFWPLVILINSLAAFLLMVGKKALQARKASKKRIKE